MCRFVESIQVIHNELQNIIYHNQRMNLTRNHFFDSLLKLDILDFVELKGLDPEKVYKCRVIYEDAFIGYELQEYHRKRINSMKLVRCEELEYTYKFADRSKLDFIARQNSDADSIIFVKENLITDCSYANLAFFDGLQWYTPEKPLLEGTKRRLLLDQGKISPRKIRVEDLPTYQKVRLINAMMDLDDSEDISIDNIGW